MEPPLISYVTWNRLGLTARNLPTLLENSSDFELHIADNHSHDDTREYLMSLKDVRIKSITLFSENRGPIYATNFILSKRNPAQFFITVDNDVNIHTGDWVKRFLEAFDAFDELGLLGAVSHEYYSRYRQILIKREQDEISYLRVLKGFVEGCCQCIHPKVLQQLGYWNEENCMGDMEMCYRINKFTDYKTGFLPGIEIDQKQEIPCCDCTVRDICRFPDTQGCFSIYKRNYRNPAFRNKYGWKYREYAKKSDNIGIRAFCPSLHDANSIENYNYNRLRAEENFLYYKNHADNG